jgi:hypothetical protein
VQGADDEEEDQSDFSRWTWYADTAASTHMGNTDEGIFDYIEINEPVTIGNGKDIWAKKRGKMRLTVLQKDGTSSDMILHDYKFVPKLDCMLFAVLKSIDQGFKISNEGSNLILTHKTFSDIRLVFDRIKYTVDGKLCRVNMTPRAKPNKKEKEMAMKNEASKVETQEESKERRRNTGRSIGCANYSITPEKKLSGGQ